MLTLWNSPNINGVVYTSEKETALDCVWEIQERGDAPSSRQKGRKIGKLF
jgi:hypothetical protein